jgi:uncharacterized protein
MTAAEPVVPRATTRDDTRQHSLPATVGYHLVPGLLILAVTLAALPLVTAAGLPPIAAVLVGILVGQLPVQLVYLLLVGRRRNGRLSLAGIVLYRERLSRWLYPLLIVGILAWSWVFYFLLRPVSSALQSTLFAWVPAGFAATGHADAASLADYPKSVVLLTFGALLIVNGLAAPIVEELYFRGYLLPRISRFGRKAPYLETVFFTLYHLWQPWLWPTVLVAFAPLVVSVHRTRNIYVGMWAHCLLNLSGALAIAGLVRSAIG